MYIVDGSDRGWRSNWQYGKYRDPLNNTYKVWMDEQMYKPRFEGQAAYFLPLLANFVSDPAGMLYNPGTALSPRYKNTFLSPNLSVARHSWASIPEAEGGFLSVRQVG